MSNLLGAVKAPKTRQRDSQRSKVYKSERAVFRPFFEPDLPDQEAVKRFTAAVLDHKEIKRYWPNAGVALHFAGRGRNSAYYRPSENLIKVPTWAYSTWTMSHELSHMLLDWSGPGCWKFASHGPEFVGIYLHVVRHAMGADDAWRLADELRTNNVRWNKKGIPGYV